VARIPLAIEIEREDHEEGVLLKIGGRVDKSTGGDFVAALREAEESDAEAILVDLSRVELMNYSGLTLLYEAHKRQLENGGRLRVVACSLQVRNLFAMSGVYDRFMGDPASPT
jgi:anti-anti-sigma factor